MINITTEILPHLVIAIGALAFVVSVITEVVKGIGGMKKVPTDIVVIVLSMVLTVVAFFAYVQYAAIAIAWYWVVAAIICGFFVAFIAMYGWDKINELWARFNPKE
jgi:hypothetical protein